MEERKHHLKDFTAHKTGEFPKADFDTVPPVVVEEVKKDPELEHPQEEESK